MSQFERNWAGQWQTGDGKSVKTFPIQTRDACDSLPWAVAEEVYKEYAAQYGKEQSLERLAQRGGFGTTETIILLFERIKRLESLINTTEL